MNAKRVAQGAELGFTLIEILIALLIGVFLVGALLTVVQTNRRVFGEQNLLSQMQDNERMALTMMGDVIQSAGYYPNYPVLQSTATALLATGSFAAGTSIYGVSTGTPAGDQLQVRYATNGGDGILNCSGLSNTNAPGPPPYPQFVNIFQITNGQLVCTMNGNPFTLVGGIPGSGLDITNMSILYGVRANASALGNSVDTYMNAAQVNALSLWGSVISVQVALTFTNPLYTTDPAHQPPTVQIQRVFDVMSQTGPTT